MNSILIVYYSRTGVTRHVAQQLAERIGADQIPIQDVRPREGMLGYLRSVMEATHGRYPSIVIPQLDLAHYALVVLATPVWASHISSPMRTFLHDHAAELKRVAFLCTMGGSGAGTAMSDMCELAGKQPDATCALTDREVFEREHDAKLCKFASQVVDASQLDNASIRPSANARVAGLNH